MSKQVIRPVDKALSEYSDFHPNSKSQVLQLISVPLVTFGLLGVIWSIPFPHLDFLGKYNGFINWASFLIAFSIYYYYKLSPVLSYGALLVVFVFSAGIVSIEKLHSTNGLQFMGQLCLGILMLGILFQFLSFKASGKTPSATQSFKRLLIAPVWMLHFLFKKARIRY